MEIGDELDRVAMAGQAVTPGQMVEALKGSEDARLAGEKKLAEVQAELNELQAKVIEERRAAGVAVALAHNNLRRARRWLEPEHLAQVWYDAYYIHSVENGLAAVEWDKLAAPGRREIIDIARRVTARFDVLERDAGDSLDAVSADILAEGESLGDALGRIELLTVAARNVWDAGIIPAIRALSSAGINILPPGTIVHGTTSKLRIPSPHRPY